MREDKWILTFDPEDWTIVNTEKDNPYTKHWGVKLWPGSGYFVSPYSVWADDEMDALTLVAEWCKKHEPGMVVTLKEVYDRMEEDIADLIKKDPESYNMGDVEDIDSLSDKKICEILYKKDLNTYKELESDVWETGYIQDWVTETNNPELFVYSENMWVSPWPDNYPSPEENEGEDE